MYLSSASFHITIQFGNMKIIQFGIIWLFHNALCMVAYDLISSFLSSCHEKATEALCIGRIQTRLGVAFVSEFYA